MLFQVWLNTQQGISKLRKIYFCGFSLVIECLENDFRRLFVGAVVVMALILSLSAFLWTFFHFVVCFKSDIAVSVG